MATIVVPYFDDAEVELAQEADRDDAKSIVALMRSLRLLLTEKLTRGMFLLATRISTRKPESRNGWMRKWGFLHPLLRFGTASGPDRSLSGRAGGTMTTGTS
nr:hypothetical protein [Rhizobium laguerreae]